MDQSLKQEAKGLGLNFKGKFGEHNVYQQTGTKNPFQGMTPRIQQDVDSIIKDLKNMEPVAAMKEANLIIGRKGKYKNLSIDESQKILKETDDHIFQRDVQYDEFGDPIKPDPEDLASGGIARVGMFLGGGLIKLAKLKKLFPRIHIDSLLEASRIKDPNKLQKMLKSFRKTEQSLDEAPRVELFDFDTTGRRPNASGGIAGQLHLNRPGYQSGLLVKLAKLLKGAGKKKDLYKHIDMEKLMKGKDKIKVYSGSVERPSNTWQSFIEDAKMFDTTPEKIAKDKFKDQWFTPFKSYAEGFTSPKDLASKMRTVDLTPKEIAIAKRYVEKINKKDKLVSMRRKKGIKPYPKHMVTTDENLVLIPRYKLKELEKSGRMKKDYMILEKLKKKLGLAEGGLAKILGV
jgi:hypothetical protein